MCYKLGTLITHTRPSHQQFGCFPLPFFSSSERREKLCVGLCLFSYSVRLMISIHPFVCMCSFELGIVSFLFLFVCETSILLFFVSSGTTQNVLCIWFFFMLKFEGILKKTIQLEFLCIKK